MSNSVSVHERLFKLWAKVTMMCVDGTRYPYYLYDVLCEVIPELPKYNPMKNRFDPDLYCLLNQAFSQIHALQKEAWTCEALQTIVDGVTPVFMEFSLGNTPIIYYAGRSNQTILNEIYRFIPNLSTSMGKRFITFDEASLCCSAESIDAAIADVLKGHRAWLLEHKK